LDVHLHQVPADNRPVATGPDEALDVADLTRHMVAGNEAAYRTFYDAYHHRLWRYLLVVAAGDEQSALEALQSALLRVVRHIKVFTSEAAFWSWLTVLARTALSDQNRKYRRYLAFLDRFAWHARLEPMPPEQAAADAKLLALLDRNLAALPTDEKQLVEWKYLDRRSVREIAQDLHTSEKAVESRLGRIRRKLKESLLFGLKNE
jgi:RNA polymerase sigma-70 factor (ECF subfamily)